ncbi:helix-turn-helix domain-containing protein [Streptomyces sp. NRRL S-350]|uniref:helix-turn-helix domain-containing protein n=1 Tax=Streptomyces sp. NRRL S-350 TaxID=1463902 RepID=UPI0004C1EB16|nr:helix-turn-helix transcriptional regulator [Streptomyces sp. NRRL S-350]
MSTPKENPMSWKYCGDQLKRWREQAGVTREQLSQAANYDIESVRSMEAGRRKPSLQLLQAADELCDAKGMLVGAAAFLKPEKFPSFSQDFMKYEPEATVLSSYESQLIPGLLQTEATARALLNAHWPPLDDDTVEERVSARLARQVILSKQTKSFSFLIDEFALLRKFGTSAEHREQLKHLLAAGRARHIDIQVVPAKCVHPGVNGAFVLLETIDHERLAYEEGQSMGLLYADPEKVNLLWQRHAMILRQALSPEESARFINKLAEELCAPM